MSSAMRSLLIYGFLLGSWLWWHNDAHAQSDNSTAIVVQQYEPGPGADDILTVQSSHVLGHLRWQLGAQINFADDVLEFYDGDVTIAKIIESQTSVDITAGLGVLGYIELGLVVPITAYRAHGDYEQFSGQGIIPEDLSSSGLGDIKLIPKLAIPGLPKSFALAIAAPVSLPTGSDLDFFGEVRANVEPRALAEYRTTSGIAIAANVGMKLRKRARLVNLLYDNELTYGLGVRAPFSVSKTDMAVIANAFGSAILDSDGDGSAGRHIEVLGGLELKPTDSITMSLAAGRGLSRGYGSPDIRIIAGFRFHLQPAAKAAQPACPYGAEDLDGYQDDDECADLDNDGDGYDDNQDMCPNEPGTNDAPGLVGCPIDDKDRVESKQTGEPGDGTAADNEPLPPLQPETDEDGDGFYGIDDNCPNEAEDVDGFEDFDGCPDKDNDKDGIPDTQDQCPLQAEIVNGKEDDDGCPDSGDRQVTVGDKSIDIDATVYFDTAKATIQERSHSILDQVAATLRANEQLNKVRVEGHTDSRGRDARNLQLSRDRAAAVRQYLIDKGIKPERIESEGYGETRPIASNRTRRGREQNRRVEFRILEESGQPVPENRDDAQP